MAARKTATDTASSDGKFEPVQFKNDAGYTLTARTPADLVRYQFDGLERVDSKKKAE